MNHLLSCQTLSLKIKTQLARITESRKTHPAENLPEDDLEKLRKYLIAEIQSEGRNMKGPKTLYVSDLDGTLLRHDQTVSPFTAETINTLTARGMLFSYTTARSLVTAKTVTKGLNTHFPLIIYNGAFVRDNVTEEILLANYFDASVYAV